MDIITIVGKIPNLLHDDVTEGMADKLREIEVLLVRADSELSDLQSRYDQSVMENRDLIRRLDVLGDAEFVIAALEKENARLKKAIELKSNYCDRKHAFCPDCRDKLPDNFCWRCEAQRLESNNAALKAELAELRETVNRYYEPQCNCKNGYPQTTSGCPVHGIKY